MHQKCSLLTVKPFPDPRIKHSIPTGLGLPPEMGYGTHGGHGSSEVPTPNSRKSMNTPRAAGVPGKHWQESGSPGPTEEGPLAHRLTLVPPPSSPWEQTRALTVCRETGCWESLIPDVNRETPTNLHLQFFILLPRPSCYIPISMKYSYKYFYTN